MYVEDRSCLQTCTAEYRYRIICSFWEQHRVAVLTLKLCKPLVILGCLAVQYIVSERHGTAHVLSLASMPFHESSNSLIQIVMLSIQSKASVDHA